MEKHKVELEKAEIFQMKDKSRLFREVQFSYVFVKLQN